MGLAFLIIAGGIVGWLTAYVQAADHGWPLRLNMAGGILGALVAGIVFSPLMSEGSLMKGSYSVDALLISILGSLLLLLTLNLLRSRILR